MDTQPKEAEMIKVYSQDDLSYKYYCWDSETDSPPRIYQAADVSESSTFSNSSHQMGPYRSPLDSQTPQPLQVPTSPPPLEEDDVAWEDDYNGVWTDQSVEVPSFNPHITDEPTGLQPNLWPRGVSVEKAVWTTEPDGSESSPPEHLNSNEHSPPVEPKRVCPPSHPVTPVNSRNHYNRPNPRLQSPVNSTTAWEVTLCEKPTDVKSRAFKRNNSSWKGIWNNNGNTRFKSPQGFKSQGVNSESTFNNQSGVKATSFSTSRGATSSLKGESVTNTSIDWVENANKSTPSSHLDEPSADSCPNPVHVSSSNSNASTALEKCSFSTPSTESATSSKKQSNSAYIASTKMSTSSDKSRSTITSGAFRSYTFGGKRLSFEIKAKETSTASKSLTYQTSLTFTPRSLSRHAPPISSSNVSGRQKTADCPSASTAANSTSKRKLKKIRWSLPAVASRKPLYLPGQEGSPTLPCVSSNDSTWISSYRNKHMVSNVPYIDSHCHLDFLFSKKRHIGSLRTYFTSDPITSQTVPDNFAGCVAIFCDPTLWKFERQWKALLSEDNVWGSFGLHPKLSELWNAETEAKLREVLLHPKVRALGEIGLDYSRGLIAFREQQKAAFRSQIKIALEFELPLVIHCREAENDCYNIMAEMVPVEYKIHRHCFTEDWDTACRWFHHFPSLMIGLTPLVTFARSLQHVAKMVPLERLLLETDAPYFIPTGVPKSSVPHSHPAMAITVAVQVASLKGISVDAVLKTTLDNTKHLYSL